MRTLFVTLCMLFCTTIAPARDIITKIDGTRTEAVVVEITDRVIKFRKPSNPTGPIYNLPIKSVASITYENGTVDYFNKEPATAHPLTSTQQLSDEELINLSESRMPKEPNSSISDSDLLRISNEMSEVERRLSKIAKPYRIIGWTAGGIVALSGIAAGIFNMYDKAAWIAGGVGIGAAICLGFNLKANSLIRKGRQIEYYSSAIIQKEVFKLDKRSIMASVNLLGDYTRHTNGLGVSLVVNF